LAVIARSIGKLVPASAAAQRAFVHPLHGIGKAAAITAQHLDIGHQMVAQRDRLRHLQMGEAGHDRIGMFFGAGQQRGDQGFQCGIGFGASGLHPQAEIHRHLIVAAARGVEPARRRADDFPQPGFDMEVDILQRQILHQLAGFIFGGDLLQTLVDGGDIGGADDAACAQHRHMRAAAGDVLPPQALVHADGGVDFLHDRRWAGTKAPAPQAVGGTAIVAAGDGSAPLVGLCRR
jgi:hypothetical protein